MGKTEAAQWIAASQRNLEMAMRAARNFDRHCHTVEEAIEIIARENLTEREIIQINF